MLCIFPIDLVEHCLFSRLCIWFSQVPVAGNWRSKRECDELTQTGSSKHSRPRDCSGEALSGIATVFRIWRTGRRAEADDPQPGDLPSAKRICGSRKFITDKRAGSLVCVGRQCFADTHVLPILLDTHGSCMSHEKIFHCQLGWPVVAVCRFRICAPSDGRANAIKFLRGAFVRRWSSDHRC